MAASNDFFEFGSDDEGDALEPMEPRNGTSSDKAPINQLSKLSLEPEGMAPPPEAVQGPLTIQTSIPVNQVPVVPQQILQPAYIQSQPMAYNLVPPAHFQAGGGGEGLQDPAIMSFSKVPQMPVQLHQVSGVYVTRNEKKKFWKKWMHRGWGVKEKRESNKEKSNHWFNPDIFG